MFGMIKYLNYVGRSVSNEDIVNDFNNKLRFNFMDIKTVSTTAAICAAEGFVSMHYGHQAIAVPSPVGFRANGDEIIPLRERLRRSSAHIAYDLSRSLIKWVDLTGQCDPFPSYKDMRRFKPEEIHSVSLYGAGMDFAAYLPKLPDEGLWKRNVGCPYYETEAEEKALKERLRLLMTGTEASFRLLEDLTHISGEILSTSKSNRIERGKNSHAINEYECIGLIDLARNIKTHKIVEVTVTDDGFIAAEGLTKARARIAGESLYRKYTSFLER